MSQILCETNSGGTISAYYIYGLGLLAKITSDGTQCYYHYDGLGSTVALTNQSGTLTDRYAYSPFGEIANTQGSTYNPFKYVGQFGVMTEPDNTLFMRARFYDPSIGRFLSKDPVDGSLNNPTTLHPYLYASSNPVCVIDPSGRTGFYILGGGFSAGAGSPWGGLFGSWESRIVVDAEAMNQSMWTNVTTPSILTPLFMYPGVGTGVLLADSLWDIASKEPEKVGFYDVASTGGVWGANVSATMNATVGYKEASDIHDVGGKKEISGGGGYGFGVVGVSGNSSGTVTLGVGLTLGPSVKVGANVSSNVQTVQDMIDMQRGNRSQLTSGGSIGVGGARGNTSPGNSSQVKPQVNVPVIVSTNPQTYSQTYTSTTRKYK